MSSPQSVVDEQSKPVDLKSETIAVFGAGAFGQALSAAVLQSGHRPTIFAPTSGNLASAQMNPALAGAKFFAMDSGNGGYWSGASVGEGGKVMHPEWPALVVMAVPAQALRSAAQWLKDQAPAGAHFAVVVASKGVEQGTLDLPHEVISAVLGVGADVAAISGPSFAIEIVRGMPTSVVCASRNAAFVRRCALLLHRPNFRIYGSKDITGVEVGGALKNVVAMAAGAADGLGLGHNGRAAVITRGLGEITQVGCALGADPITFLGLSGLGDLVLTCTGELSRNRTFGVRLASGEPPEAIMKSLGEVVEGYSTALSAFELSRKLGTNTPIIDAVHGVLYEGVPVAVAFEQLARREQKQEFEWLKN
jgi:glycerol-3-phosphate dehydrogenase (NAD(P)+)